MNNLNEINYFQREFDEKNRREKLRFEVGKNVL